MWNTKKTVAAVFSAMALTLASIGNAIPVFAEETTAITEMADNSSAANMKLDEEDMQKLVDEIQHNKTAMENSGDATDSTVHDYYADDYYDTDGNATLIKQEKIIYDSEEMQFIAVTTKDGISSVEAYRSSMVFSSSVLTIASYSSKNAYSLVSCFVITTSTSIFLQFLPACNAFRISAKKKAAVDILQQLFIRLLWFLLVLLCISTESKETASDALPVPCQSEQVLSSIIPKKIAGYNYFTSKIRIFSAGTETSPKITSLIAAACAASRPSVCTTTLALSPSR